jgi:hypothetical protein
MTVVPACSVNSAAALDTLAYSLMAVLGGMAGAALLDWSGPSSCFLADAACSMVAAGLLSRLVPADAERMGCKGGGRRPPSCHLCDRGHPRARRQRGLLGWLRPSSEGWDSAAEPLLTAAAANAEDQHQHQHRQRQQHQSTGSTGSTGSIGSIGSTGSRDHEAAGEMPQHYIQ